MWCGSASVGLDADPRWRPIRSPIRKIGSIFKKLRIHRIRIRIQDGEAN
jgi:hypothetical protein